MDALAPLAIVSPALALAHFLGPLPLPLPFLLFMLGVWLTYWIAACLGALCYYRALGPLEESNRRYWQKQQQSMAAKDDVKATQNYEGTS